MKNDKHDKIKDRLSEYYEGEIDDKEAALFQEHIASCAECGQELELISRTVRLLHALGEEEAPAGLRANIMEAVQAETWLSKVGRLLLGEGQWVPARALAYVFLAVFLGVALYSFPFGKYKSEYIETGRLAVEEKAAIDSNLISPDLAATITPTAGETGLTRSTAEAAEEIGGAPASGAVATDGALAGAMDALGKVESSGAASGLDGRMIADLEGGGHRAGGGAVDNLAEAEGEEPREAERRVAATTGSEAGPARDRDDGVARDEKALREEPPAIAFEALEAPTPPVSAVGVSTGSSGGFALSAACRERSVVVPELYRNRLAPKPEAQMPGSPPQPEAGKAGEVLAEAVEAVDIPVTGEYSEIYSGAKDQCQLVLHDAGSFAAVWNKVYGIMEPRPEAPKIDFSDHFAIAVFLGERSSGGFKIRVESVKWADGTLIVTVNQAVPDPGSMVTLALTQPIHIVVLPRRVPNTKHWIDEKTPVVFDLQ